MPPTLFTGRRTAKPCQRPRVSPARLSSSSTMASAARRISRHSSGTSPRTRTGRAADLLALDHIRIEGSLREKREAAQPARLLLKDLDELGPDDLALLLRIRHPLERAEKAIRGVDGAALEFQMSPKRPQHRLRLPLAEEAVIDKDRDQTIADGPVNQQRRDGGIHPPTQRAQHPLPSDFLTDPLDGLLNEGSHSPCRRTPADPEDEVLEDLPPPRRVNHLRMKLDGVPRAAPVPPGSGGGVLRRREGGPLGGKGQDPVPVAHPGDRVGSQSRQKVRGVVNTEFGPAVLPDLGRIDLPTQQVGQDLHPVADPQDRPLQRQHLSIQEGGIPIVDTGRTPGQDDPLWTTLSDELDRRGAGKDLTVDSALPDPPSDELGGLRAKVKDQDRVSHTMAGAG